MSLNPLREALGTMGLRASEAESGFKAVADAALGGFRSIRKDLERRVHKGELTPKVAREEAKAAAARLEQQLRSESANFSPASRSFQDRLASVSARREALKNRKSIEELQKETNQILRSALIEQQIQSRLAEFEGQTYRRPMTGGAPSTSLDALLRFNSSSLIAEDEAAMEWARRQLEGMRGRTFSSTELLEIDRACDRPGRINPRLVASYVEEMAGRSNEEMEVFVTQALEGGDGNRCVAAFVLARQATDLMEARWARRTLEGIDRFPDVALANLRIWEAEAREYESQAARTQAEFAVAMANAEASFAGLRPPSEADLRRQARIDARPAVKPGEAIGLNLSRRGLSAEEFARQAEPMISVDFLGGEPETTSI